MRVNWSPWSIWVQKAWKHWFFKTRQKGAVQWTLKRVNGFVLLIGVKEAKQKLVLQTLSMRRVQSVFNHRQVVSKNHAVALYILRKIGKRGQIVQHVTHLLAVRRYGTPTVLRSLESISWKVKMKNREYLPWWSRAPKSTIMEGIADVQGGWSADSTIARKSMQQQCVTRATMWKKKQC